MDLDTCVLHCAALVFEILQRESPLEFDSTLQRLQRGAGLLLFGFSMLNLGRKLGDIDDIALALGQRELQGIDELSNVAGPFPREKRLFGRIRQRGGSPVRAFRDLA